MPSEFFKKLKENLDNHNQVVGSSGLPPTDENVTEEYEQPITDKPYDAHPPLKAEPASNNPLDTPEQGGLVAFAAGEPKIMEVDTSTFGAGPGNAGSYQSSDTKTPYGTVGTRKKVGGMTDQ